MAKAIKINSPILRLLTICVALVSLLYFHQVIGSEGVSQFPVSEKLSVDDPLIRINLQCKYKYTSDYCYIFDLDIRTKNIEVASFTGTHFVGKTNEDVETILFVNGTMLSLPSGIGKLFKNLRYLTVRPGLGTKHISRLSLQNMEKLKFLWVDFNEIEELPFDTLWDLPDLTHFLLSGNKLTVLDERTFEKNERLIQVGVSGNRLEFLPRNLFKNNVLLQLVSFRQNSLKNIEIDFTLLKNLRVADLLANACIDLEYYNYFGDNSKELTELQGQISANCSSTN